MIIILFKGLMKWNNHHRFLSISKYEKELKRGKVKTNLKPKSRKSMKLESTSLKV